jgi:hypothetical protein
MNNKEDDWLLDEALAIMRLCSASEFDEAKRRSDKALVKYSQLLMRQGPIMPLLLFNTIPCNPVDHIAQRMAANKAALLKSMAGKKISKGGAENSATARNRDNTWGPKAEEFACDIWQRNPALTPSRVAQLVEKRWKDEGLDTKELPKARSVADAIRHLDPKAKIAGPKRRQRKSQKAKKSS